MSPFFFNGHCLVVFVVGLTAQQTDAHLFISAIKLQKPLMLLTDPLLQVIHWVDELVPRQGGNSLVRLQVVFAVRRQTHEAGLQGLELHFCAHITRHLPWCINAFRCRDFPLLYLDGNLLDDRVCGDLRPHVESFITHGAVA